MSPPYESPTTTSPTYNVSRDGRAPLLLTSREAAYNNIMTTISCYYYKILVFQLAAVGETIQNWSAIHLCTRVQK